MKELGEVFDDLDTLLKHPDVGGELTAKGVNVSLALVAADALRAYVFDADKRRAHEDFETVAEEIRTRLGASAAGAGGDGSKKNEDGTP
jgi:hypothetical protein